MAESAVSLFVEKLATLVQEEVKLLKGVRGEIVLIKNEFEYIEAILASAEFLQDDDPVLKVWVKQVIDVAYDTEDILEEFMLRLSRDHGHGFMGYLRKTKSFIQNLKARHRISSKIVDIRSTYSTIGKMHRRYDDNLYHTKQSASTSTGGTSWHDLREDAFLVEEGELVGINEPREEIVKLLVDREPELEVVSILGMGGLGKTTLAGRVYKNQQVKAHFQSHAWINVSQSYKIENILRDMIVQLHREFQQPIPEGLQFMTRGSLKTIVSDFLQPKRYIIVLDDVWKKEALEDIKNALPNSSFYSRILITTRMSDIAAHFSKQSKIYILQPLSPEQSWFLLCKKALRGKPCPPRLEQESLSQQILERCEGLPLALVAIGSFLFTKDVQEWKTFCGSLAEELESNGISQNLVKILSLSYTDLDYNLKSCFMYLVVFPEDLEIECATLIRLWIAEGFVKERGRRTREEVAQRYLEELVNRSLVQIVETTFDGRIRSCRVHDLMRESILSKLGDINFVSFAFEKTVKLPERVRRLSVQYTCNDVLKQLDLPHLHSLLIFELATSSSSSEQFVPSGCRLLRVIDLRDSPLHEFPQQILVMFHLKYLSLRRTQVRIIPRLIGKLQNLETLDLKHTLVSELPAEITKLKKLHYLMVYSYAKHTPSRPFCSVAGFSAPQGIGALASLQKLCFVKAGSGWSKDTMQELGKLHQLRRLGVIDLKKDDAKELCYSLKNMTKLQSLDVTAESELEVIDLDFLSSPPLLLQRLYIKGCLKKLPNWLSRLNNLARVFLKRSRLKSSPLIGLKNLPNLVELQMDNVFDGENLEFGDREFPKLKILRLANMENLRFVLMNGQAMPGLESLTIHKCKHLDWQSLLFVIHGLTLLTYLLFKEMPEEFALAFYPYDDSEMMREGNMQEYYEEVMERDPEVYFVWWEEDNWEWYDLGSDCYNDIKEKVMSHGEVLREVS